MDDTVKNAEYVARQGLLLDGWLNCILQCVDGHLKRKTGYYTSVAHLPKSVRF